MTDKSLTTVSTSLIIVNYNSANYIHTCLQAITTTTTHTEIIVVDNASTDDSPTTIAQRWPQITLLHSDHNLGFGGANNLGAHHASGDILIFLNPDTIPQPNWLQPLISPLQADNNVGLTTAKILIQQNPTQINAAGNDIHCTGITLCRGLHQPASSLNTPLPVSAISGAAFAIRRHLFLDLGGFDHTFFMYMEDTDLSWRAWLAGWQTLYTPDSLIWHDYSLRFGPNKIFYQERNRYLMLLKSLHWRTLLLMLPALLGAEIISWGFVLWGDRPNWRNKLRVYRWLFQNRKMILQKRDQTQQQRQKTDRDLIQLMGFRLAFTQVTQGFIATMAQTIFDPFFFLCHRLLLLGVRW